MAKKQRIMWTALPNGLVPGSGGKKLRLSVFVSPKLEDDVSPGRLDHFPDFTSGQGVNWASLVNELSFRVEVMNNLAPALSDVPSLVGTYSPVSQASPELWDSMFKPSTKVPSSVPKIPAVMKVNSFSVPAVIKQIQDQYVAVGANPRLISKLPLVNLMVTPAGLKSSPIMRLIPAIQRPPTVRVRALGAGPDPAFKEFEDFHQGFDGASDDGGVSAQAAEVAMPVPKRPEMDFHTALSTLGEFPGMLLGLGIVLDFEIPFTNTLRLGKRLRVVPTDPPGGSASPWTAYNLVPGPRTRTGTYVSAKTFETRPKTGDIRGGYLVMRNTTVPSKSPVTVATVDVDFAGLAVKATAVSAAKQMKEVLQAKATQATSVKAAASSGVNVDVARPVAGTVSPTTTYEPMGLPGLGPSTLSLSRNGAGAKLKAMVAALAGKEAKLEADQDKLILNYAEEVSRGYRIDVWDSVTRKWHSLCRRVGTYRIGDTDVRFEDDAATLAEDGDATLQDEGWIQTAAVSDPNKTEENKIPTEVWVHEHMFDWTGWSLAVPRPGAALAVHDDGSSSTIRESVGPDGSTHGIGNWVDPAFPLATEFTVPDGSLTRKRFGTTYRFRARSVDLAGHSVPFSAGSTNVDPGGAGDRTTTVTDKIVNRRTDPVKAPTVVIAEPMKPGESPAVLVVRSNYNTPSAEIEPTSRHITPPRSSVEMAEELGGLDDALTPGKPVDPTLYSMLVERDAFEFEMETAQEGTVKATGKAMAIGPSLPATVVPPNLPPLLPGQVLRDKPEYVPKEYVQQAPVEKIENEDGTLPYLPDMLSRGATLKGLPGTPSTTKGVRMSAAAVSPTLGSIAKVGVVKIPITSTQYETVKTILVDFDRAGQKWYNKRSFKLIIKGIEATDKRVTPHATPKTPLWNSTARTLTVELPKGDKVLVELSSFTNPADLNLFEVYEWGVRPFVLKTTVGRLVGLKQMANPIATVLPTLVKRNMTTTMKALVATTIIGRNWTITPHDTLTLVHAVQQPVIEPKFTGYARVNRKPGETHGTLVDWMPIHGKSTAKLSVQAHWHENADDPSAGVPKWKDPDGTDTSVEHEEKVFEVTVGPSDTSVLDLGLKRTRLPAFAVVRALADDPKANAQRHFFGDTHHRLIEYKATATSRFPEFFADDPNADFARTSVVKSLHVPSSARPTPPAISYVIPTYGWTKTATTSKRLAGGLRVYLERPWFSSGDNEQLAVVLPWTSIHPQTRFHTQWGDDPIWSSQGKLGSTRPSTASFGSRAAGIASGIKLAEDGSKASIVAYDVDFDPESDMWFADMQIDPGGAYFPFIKLVLARFQRYSLSGYELSPVAFADFAQLAPERSASILWSTSARGATQLTVTVTGQTYSDSHVSKFHAGKRATVTAQFERQIVSQSEAEKHPTGWLPVGDELELAQLPLTLFQLIKGITTTTWRRTFTYPTTAGPYRLVIREYEWHHTVDTPPSIVVLTPQTSRLVYADTMLLTPPSAPVAE